MTEAVLDRGGRPVIERFKGFNGAPRIKTRTYLPQGWLRAETAFRRADSEPEMSTYAYDSHGRRVQAIDPDNGLRTWRYDRQQLTYTNARGNRKVSTVDARGQLLRIVDGAGSSDQTARSNVWGPFGVLSSSLVEGIDASRSVFVHDERGLLLGRTDRERGTATYRYNAFGQPVFRRDSEGRETTYSYDAIGRVTRRAVERAGTLRSQVDYVYDAIEARTKNGKLLRLDIQDSVAGNQRHRTDYFYDGASRIFRQQQEMPSDAAADVDDSFVIGYSYDDRSRLVSLQYPKLKGQPFGAQARFEYAPTDIGNGRLTRVKIDDPLGPDLTVWEALATDGQDRLVEDQSGDGVRTLRELDWRGQPFRVSMTSGAITLLAELYRYDAEGNLMSREHIDGDNDPVERFQYDALDRLTIVTHGAFGTPADTWTYDKLGNLIASVRRGTMTYDPERPTQLIEATDGIFPARRFTYDAVGNQVGRPEGGVAYNDFDLPARIAESRGNVVATFAYTGNGERARGRRRRTRSPCRSCSPG